MEFDRGYITPYMVTLTHTTFRVPRSRLTIRVDRASPSTSSAMMSSFLPDWTTCSRMGSSSWMLEIFLSVMRRP